MTKDFPTNEVEQIDALLHLNANGSLTSPVPGLAIELLKKYRAHLSALAQPVALRQALIEVTKCETALRMGGPAPEDLEGLSIALEKAVEIAANALDAAQPQAAPVEMNTEIPGKPSIDPDGGPKRPAGGAPSLPGGGAQCSAASEKVAIGWTTEANIASLRTHPKHAVFVWGERGEVTNVPLHLNEPQTVGMTEPLQCLRCGTVDAFGPVSAEKK